MLLSRRTYQGNYANPTGEKLDLNIRLVYVAALVPRPIGVTAMRFWMLILALLFPSVVSADVYLVKAPPSSVFRYGHVAVDALPVDGVPMIAEFQRSPDGLILVRRDVFMARYPGIDVVPNGLVYDGSSRFDDKRYIVLPLLGIRSNCTTFVSGIDPNSRRIRLPDVYAAKLNRQQKRGTK